MQGSDGSPGPEVDICRHPWLFYPDWPCPTAEIHRLLDPSKGISFWDDFRLNSAVTNRAYNSRATDS